MVWAFAIVRYQDDNFFTNLASLVSRRLQNWPDLEISLLAWSFATMQIKHLALTEAFKREFVLRLEHLDTDKIGQLAWSLDILGDLDRNLALQCVQALRSAGAENKLKGEKLEILVQAVTGLQPHLVDGDPGWAEVTAPIRAVRQSVLNTLSDLQYETTELDKASLLSHELTHLGPHATRWVLDELGIPAMNEEAQSICANVLARNPLPDNTWRTSTAKNIRAVLTLQGESRQEEIIISSSDETLSLPVPFWTLHLRHSRERHVEVKALTKACEEVEHGGWVSTVGLLVDQFPCLSCLAVIAQFKHRLDPGINFFVSFKNAAPCHVLG